MSSYVAIRSFSYPMDFNSLVIVIASTVEIFESEGVSAVRARVGEYPC